MKIDWSFYKSEWRILLFALMMAAWSGPGQTFFISIFNKDLMERFDLSRSDIGLIYMCATLLSAFCTIKAGRQIDVRPLQQFAKWVILGMIAACLFYPFISHVSMVFIGFFLLRFFGQSLMGHTASTTMARRYRSQRGRALSIANLGLPISEAILPPAVVLTLGILGANNIWFVLAGLIFVMLYLPLNWFLQRTSLQDGGGVEEIIANRQQPRDQWSAYQLLKDKVFYLALPLIILPGAIVTALLFHQHTIIETKDWTLFLWAASFSFYSLGSVIGNISAGVLIDRFSARKIVFINLMPLTIGLLVLLFLNHSSTIFVMMFLIGMGGGTNGTVVSALWAELYGVKNLGAIKGFALFIMIASSAIGPVIYGFSFDYNISLEAIVLSSAILTTFASVTSWFIRYVDISSLQSRTCHL